MQIINDHMDCSLRLSISIYCRKIGFITQTNYSSLIPIYAIDIPPKIYSVLSSTKIYTARSLNDKSAIYIYYIHINHLKFEYCKSAVNLLKEKIWTNNIIQLFEFDQNIY